MKDGAPSYRDIPGVDLGGVSASQDRAEVLIADLADHCGDTGWS